MPANVNPVASGEKTAPVGQAITGASGTFSLADRERACPGVSRDTLRRILRERAGQGTVERLGLQARRRVAEYRAHDAAAGTVNGERV